MSALCVHMCVEKVPGTLSFTAFQKEELFSVFRVPYPCGGTVGYRGGPHPPLSGDQTGSNPPRGVGGLDGEMGLPRPGRRCGARPQ